jgi:hypothetical protein
MAATHGHTEPIEQIWFRPPKSVLNANDRSKDHTHGASLSANGLKCAERRGGILPPLIGVYSLPNSSTSTSRSVNNSNDAKNYANYPHYGKYPFSTRDAPPSTVTEYNPGTYNYIPNRHHEVKHFNFSLLKIADYLRFREVLQKNLTLGKTKRWKFLRHAGGRDSFVGSTECRPTSGRQSG